jgi:hypothetical protein
MKLIDVGIQTGENCFLTFWFKYNKGIIMRAHEIMENASVGGTSAGSIAPVESSLGVVSRNGGSLLTGKYTTGADPTPNTPKEYKRNKNVSGRFKNSPGK